MRKAPLNPTRDLDAQNPPGRGGETITRGSVTSRPDMTVPGVRKNEKAVGTMHERSAAHYGDAQKIK